ncbi:MAG: hypothetical protein WCE50_08485 [Candidatus Acidiferrum sp.]
MKISSPDKCLSRRYSFKTPVRVGIWKSTAPEESDASLNLSQ